jgi:hypothetical protein
VRVHARGCGGGGWGCAGSGRCLAWLCLAAPSAARMGCAAEGLLPPRLACSNESPMLLRFRRCPLPHCRNGRGSGARARAPALHGLHSPAPLLRGNRSPRLPCDAPAARAVRRRGRGERAHAHTRAAAPSGRSVPRRSGAPAGRAASARHTKSTPATAPRRLRPLGAILAPLTGRGPAENAVAAEELRFNPAETFPAGLNKWYAPVRAACTFCLRPLTDGALKAVGVFLPAVSLRIRFETIIVNALPRHRPFQGCRAASVGGATQSGGPHALTEAYRPRLCGGCHVRAQLGAMFGPAGAARMSSALQMVRTQERPVNRLSRAAAAASPPARCEPYTVALLGQGNASQCPTSPTWAPPSGWQLRRSPSSNLSNSRLCWQCQHSSGP